MKNTVLKNISLAILSGLLCFLAFPPVKLALLAWVCFVPLFLAVRSAGPKGAFWYSYVAGLVFFGCLLYWLPNVTVPGTVILVVVLAVFYGLFGVITRYVFKYSMDLLLLPFVWVVLEFIRSHLFTGFPWGLLGYTQYKNINLIQIADLTGTYGVSFLVMVFNVAAFAVVIRSKRKLAYMMTALIFLTLATTYGIYRIDNYLVWGSPRMSVVQGNIPQQLKWDERYAENIVRGYSTLTREAAADEPDMIIWPETSYPYLMETKEAPAEEISGLAAGAGISILAGGIYMENGSYYNSAVFFDEKGGVAGKYYKIHLVPFGEYIPFEKYISFLRGYIDKPIGDFAKGKEYTLFQMKSVTSSFNSANNARTRQTNFYKFGVLICFEDIFPYLTRGFVRAGANFMVNMTNDAWFGNTAAPEQHLQASVFRAVENRVPIIRAANTGISCFVDSTGEMLSRVEEGGKDIFISGFATDNVKVYAGRAFYTKYGDVFVYFCAFMMVLLLATEAVLLKRARRTLENKA